MPARAWGFKSPLRHVVREACGGSPSDLGRACAELRGGPVRSVRYHYDTMGAVAMTLRLTDEEQAALKERADAAGISMQEAARQAVRDYISRSQHRDRVMAAAGRIIVAHAEALERLGR